MKKKTEPKQPAPLRVSRESGEAESRALARTVLRPAVRAAITTQAYSKQFGGLDVTALVDELAAQNLAVSKGDLARSEAMLLSHAHTLDAIFHELVRRAGLNMGEYLGAAETYMRLGLKAQSQCRATLETLAAIKNPTPVTFVRQANVAHGLQQVNNSAAPPDEVACARESESRPNKVLEKQPSEWMDRGSTQATIPANSSLETLAEVHRTEDGRR